MCTKEEASKHQASKSSDAPVAVEPFDRIRELKFPPSHETGKHLQSKNADTSCDYEDSLDKIDPMMAHKFNKS